MRHTLAHNRTARLQQHQHTHHTCHTHHDGVNRPLTAQPAKNEVVWHARPKRGTMAAHENADARAARQHITAEHSTCSPPTLALPVHHPHAGWPRDLKACFKHTQDIHTHKSIALTLQLIMCLLALCVSSTVNGHVACQATYHTCNRTSQHTWHCGVQHRADHTHELPMCCCLL